MFLVNFSLQLLLVSLFESVMLDVWRCLILRNCFHLYKLFQLPPSFFLFSHLLNLNFFLHFSSYIRLLGMKHQAKRKKIELKYINHLSFACLKVRRMDHSWFHLIWFNINISVQWYKVWIAMQLFLMISQLNHGLFKTSCYSWGLPQQQFLMRAITVTLFLII